jgi:heterodisulfide reductase subunit C
MVKDLKIDRITKISDEFLDLLRDAGYLEIGACIQCGNCTASCPSGRRTALRTREIMRKAILGQEEVLRDKELWLCTTCYTCYERCPRNIPITDIIVFLRNIAVERGNILGPHWNVCNTLFNTGHIVPIDNEKHNILRESYGVSRIPPTVHAYPEALKEVQNLIESTGFDKKVKIGKFEQKIE